MKTQTVKHTSSFKIANGSPFKGYLEIYSTEGINETVAQAKPKYAKFLAAAPDLITTLKVIGHTIHKAVMHDEINQAVANSILEEIDLVINKAEGQD